MHTSLETSASPWSDPAPAAWREVDLGAVRRNVAVLADVAAPAALMVVVKADAYSHGAAQVAREDVRGFARRSLSVDAITTRRVPHHR